MLGLKLNRVSKGGPRCCRRAWSSLVQVTTCRIGHSNYQGHCCIIVHWTLRNKLKFRWRCEIWIWWLQIVGNFPQCAKEIVTYEIDCDGISIKICRYFLLQICIWIWFCCDKWLSRHHPVDNDWMHNCTLNISFWGWDRTWINIT